MNTTTKIAKLTALNIKALEANADELKVTLGKTTAEFEGTHEEAATRVRQVQEKVAETEGRKAGTYASLHAVARKLENWTEGAAERRERLSREAADKAEPTPAKGKKAVPTKKAAPAKATAGTRAIPTGAVNSARQAWIDANGGMDAYRKQYNGGWDSATYGQGEKKAASGEASVAWMDGYTDRQANPGKEGITAKWSALRSTTAPVKKV